MSWSSKRKSIYIGSLTSIVFVVLIIVAIFYFYEKPTCFDGKLNQEENGIDCGGPCLTVCGFEIINHIVHWARVSRMTEDSYSATALIENPNVSAEAYSVPYIFKMYDDDGLLVTDYIGEAFIPANKQFPIFSGAIYVGNRIPTKTVFEFTAEPNWLETEPGPEIFIESIRFYEKNGLPRVTAIINNESVKDIENVEVVVLLLDINDNLINSSKTFLDVIRKDSFENVVFTWPDAFDREVIKVDIFPVSKLR